MFAEICAVVCRIVQIFMVFFHTFTIQHKTPQCHAWEKHMELWCVEWNCEQKKEVVSCRLWLKEG
jgi:hypothetical protein